MLKKSGFILMVCLVLLLVGNRFYDTVKEPEITDSFSIQTSASPNEAHVIEIKEMYAQNEEGFHADADYTFESLRIYYGKYGRQLEDFKEIKEINMPAVDRLEVSWKNDEQADINVLHKNDEGESFVFASYRFDLADETLTKGTV